MVRAGFQNGDANLSIVNTGIMCHDTEKLNVSLLAAELE